MLHRIAPLALALALLAAPAAGQSAAVPADSADAPAALSAEEHRAATRRMHGAYPALMRDAGIGGPVVVEFRVGTDGRVDGSTVRVLRAPDEGTLFHQASRRVLAGATFTPARRGGIPVPGWLRARLDFDPNGRNRIALGPVESPRE